MYKIRILSFPDCYLLNLIVLSNSTGTCPLRVCTIHRACSICLKLFSSLKYRILDSYKNYDNIYSFTEWLYPSKHASV